MTETQVKNDLTYLWTLNDISNFEIKKRLQLINVFNDPYDCIFDSHAVAIITEWDEFKLIDWEKIYDIMKKPAFVFDGRNILNKNSIKSIGFNFKGVGKI